MSTSGSTDYSTTRLDVINRALSLLGVVPQGGTPTTYDLSDANLALNGLVKSWMADGLQLWAITSYNIPLTDGVNKYRIGLTQTVEYNMLGNKSVSGNPIQIYYDPQRVYGDLYVFPTPTTVEATNNTIVINYQRPFEDLDADVDEPDFPQEWFDALCYGLACRLAPAYGIPLADRKQLWNEVLLKKRWIFYKMLLII